MLATSPKPSTLIESLGVSATHGLLAVVQTTVVEVWAVTVQTLLSIVTLIVFEAWKFVPVKVTLSLPRTEPKRVLMAVRVGVFVFEKVIGLKSVEAPSIISLGVHE